MITRKSLKSIFVFAILFDLRVYPKRIYSQIPVFKTSWKKFISYVLCPQIQYNWVHWFHSPFTLRESFFFFNLKYFWEFSFKSMDQDILREVWPVFWAPLTRHLCPFIAVVHTSIFDINKKGNTKIATRDKSNFSFICLSK